MCKQQTTNKKHEIYENDDEKQREQREVYEEANALINYDMTNVVVDKFVLRMQIKRWKESYTMDTAYMISDILLKIFKVNRMAPQQRIAILCRFDFAHSLLSSYCFVGSGVVVHVVDKCSDEKLAFIFAVCLANFRQARIERTINVPITVQTILAKFPPLDYLHLLKANQNENVQLAESAVAGLTVTAPAAVAANGAIRNNVNKRPHNIVFKKYMDLVRKQCFII